MSTPPLWRRAIAEKRQISLSIMLIRSWPIELAKLHPLELKVPNISQGLETNIQRSLQLGSRLRAHLFLIF
jgi:hypothetical protein